MEKTLIWN